MKKLISMLLAFCMVVVPLIATVSATNITNTQTTQTTKTLSKQELYTPINSNFKKQAVFSESGIDLDALGVASWCREDFIQLYELGFTELATHNYSSARQANEDVSYLCAISTLYNLLKMYYGEEIIKGEIPLDDWHKVTSYLTQNGIIHSNEIKPCTYSTHTIEGSTVSYMCVLLLEGDYSDCVPADSFGPNTSNYHSCGASSYNATRQDIQVLVTRLFNAIDVGEPINSLDKVRDVDKNNTPNLNFDGILELYNMGILTGDTYGNFNPYDYMTLNEFVTVIARIVFPNRRVQITPEAYSQKLETPYKTIQTYNSIDSYWYGRIKELSHLDSLYITKTASDEVMTVSEVFYILDNAMNLEWNSNTVGPFASDSDEYSNFLRNNFYDSSVCSALGVGDAYIITTFRNTQISKKDFARLLLAFAEERFMIYNMPSIPLNNELAKDLSKEDARLLTKAVALGIIEDTAEDFSDKPITKSDFEKMLIQFMIKFSTVVPENQYKFGDKRINLATYLAELSSITE